MCTLNSRKIDGSTVVSVGYSLVASLRLPFTIELEWIKISKLRFSQNVDIHLKNSSQKNVFQYV